MGYAIAECLAEKGAQVFMVSGPVHITTRHPNIKVIPVVSAQEMYDKCTRIFPECDAAILSAAVSDYTPVIRMNKKIKRKDEKLHLELKPTLDIAAALGHMKKKDQVLAGFALESENETWNATRKIKSKNLDFIVMNSLRDKGAGFGTDTNKVTFIDRDNNIREFKLKEKREVAEDIIDKLLTYFL
jgi:phosphopantothenoylcysteine decarboxylase/phosphopantothenate--cysteine ligase